MVRPTANCILQPPVNVYVHGFGSDYPVIAIDHLPSAHFSLLLVLILVPAEMNRSHFSLRRSATLGEIVVRVY